MAAFAHKKDDEVPKAPAAPPVLHDDPPPVPHQHGDEQHAPAPPVSIDPHALLPWFADVHPAGVPQPKQEDLQARADRMYAEQLLSSKRLETGADASKAVDVLLDVPPDHRAQVIDQLDPRAFENLLERVPDSEREKLEGLVDASKDPRRKLRMWAVVHKARAKNDLDKYRGDFGSDDEQTKEQARREAKFDRREAGVKSDAAEVDADVKRLLEKADQGQLSLAEVDQLRERKDLELKLEMKYNIDLTAEAKPRKDGSAVEWTKQDLENMDLVLAQIPPQHLQSRKMAPGLQRLATRDAFHEPRARYVDDKTPIEVYDIAETKEGEAREIPPRSLVSDEFRKAHGDAPSPFEYTVTHEIGHNVADEKKKAFEKFRKVGHWEDDLTTEQAKAIGATDEALHDTDDIRRGAYEKDKKASSIVSGDRRFSPGNFPEKGHYASVDATAVPATSHMTYAAMNSKEHFAEVYAQAILSPETLYAEYVTDPAKAAEKARGTLAQDRERLAALQKSPWAPAFMVALTKLAISSDEADVKAKDKAQAQQGEEFSIMRNDVFGADKAQAAAEARLHGAGVAPQRIAEFRDRAAHASTPQQIELLEREAKAHK